MTRKLYTGQNVDVSFDGELCEHAGVCVRGIPEVFNTEARPWINPDGAWTPEAQKLLIDVVGKCPSGALKIERPEVKERVDAADINVTNNVEAKRYDAHVDGDLAGFADYILATGLITFSHTEIDPAFEGRGIGSVLIKAALDDVRGSGRKVQPLCPFVKSYIAKHPEYNDLLY